MLSNYIKINYILQFFLFLLNDYQYMKIVLLYIYIYTFFFNCIHKHI